MLHRYAIVGRFARVGIALVASLLVALAVGCGDELDPTEPEGAYYIFRDALLKGDAEAVWKRTDETSKEYFQQRYEQLEEMDATIERYLPQTDHKIARKQSGTILLDEVKNGKGLFLKVFQSKSLPSLPNKHAIKVGSDIEELKVAEDESAAKVVTRAGQEYVLKAHKKSEEWHVMLVRSSEKVDGSFGWLKANESALQKTVEDLIAEEREKREAIIAELMNKKD